MCEQCKEIDAKIEHYQRVADRITDQTTIAGLNNLIRDLLRKQAACIPTTPRMSLRSERSALIRKQTTGGPDDLFADHGRRLRAPH
jgi:beta-phosphoglucomutase-like phosphatase (HAD superfamily)